MGRSILVITFLSLGFLLTSCIDSGAPENESTDDGDGAGTKSAAADTDEQMSFPEALKLKRKLAREVEKVEEELAERSELVSAEEAATEDLNAIAAYRDQLAAAKASAQESLDFWRNATRESFIGVQLPEIATSDGAVYRQVTIDGVSDSTLSIRHEGGTAGVEIATLPLGLRKNLIHEPTVLAEIE